MKTRRFIIPPRNPKTTAEKHQTRIAHDTMKLSCVGCLVLGGPNHYEAASIIHRITGVFVNIDAGCTCNH